MADGRAAPQLDHTVRDAVRRNGIGDFTGARQGLLEGFGLVRSLPEEERAFWRARLLITLAYSDFELRGEQVALAHLAEARTLAGEARSGRLTALAHVQECNLRARATDWDGSIAAGDEAERLIDVLEPEERFALHLNRGLARLAVVDLDRAEDDLDAALALAEVQDWPALRYKAVHNKGCLAYVRGDLPRALVLMREADELGVDVARDRNRLDQAQVLVDAGLVHRARALLERTLDDAIRAGHRIEEGAIHLDLARCSILLDDPAAARDHAGAARAAYEALGARDRRRRALLVSAQVALAEHADPAEVELLLAEWPGGSTTRPDDRTAARLRAEVLLRRGALAESSAVLGALGRPGSQGVAAQLHEDYLRAAIAAAEGDRRRSREVFRRASSRFARHQGRTQSLEARAALALHARKLAEFDVAQALASGHPASVFASLERWRAGSARMAPVRPSGDVQTARLMSELRAAQRRRLEAEGDERARLQARVADLTRQIERREWESERLAEGASPTAPISPGAASSHAASADAEIISLFSSGGVLHALVVGETLRRVAVGPLDETLRAAEVLASDLRALSVSRRLPSALTAALHAAVADSAHRLDEFLFGPGSGLSVSRRGTMVIVPNRGLSSVPWNMLGSLTDRRVVVARSVTGWVRATVPASPVSTRVRAAAGPGLPEAPREVAQVLALWGRRADPRRGRGLSSAADVVDALGSATVVHLAAHGTQEDDNPMFSTLRMADGPVFLHELPRPCHAEHVVLSACDVGRSVVRSGDEALGLTAGLLSLGARSVLSSVAAVDDEVSRSAMVGYHERLATGASAAEALAGVITEVPAARTFCVYGADWSAPAP